MPSGKITHRKGPHKSVKGALVDRVPLSEAHRAEIEKILNRKLTSVETSMIESGLELLRHFRELPKSAPSRQDTLASIKHIATLTDSAKLVSAFRDTDSQAHCEIVRELHSEGLQDWRDILQPSPESIRRAAARALCSLPRLSGTKPPQYWRGEFKSFCIDAWKMLGRSDDSVHRAVDDEGTPLVQFACAVHKAAFDKTISASGTVKILKMGG